MRAQAFEVGTSEYEAQRRLGREDIGTGVTGRDRMGDVMD